MGTTPAMPDPIVISPRGELDITSARALGTQLSEASGQRDATVVLDMSEVTFLDSTVLGTVLRAAGQLGRSGRRLGVVAPEDSATQHLLEVSGLAQSFDVHRSLDEARGAVRD